MEPRLSNTASHDSRLQELLSHSSWIRQIAFATIRDAQIAEDVTQEVLIKALQEPGRRGTLLRRWLATVTRRHALNWARGRQRSRRREERVAQLEGETTEPAPDVVLAYREVMDAMQRLQPKDRKVLLLRFHEELSFKQVAAQISTKEGTARVRLHRALEALRQELGGAQRSWRQHCLLLAPGAIRKSPPVIPVPSFAVSMVLLLIVAVLGGLSWQKRESGPVGNTSEIVSALGADLPAQEDSKPVIFQSVEREMLPSEPSESQDLPPIDRTFQGRVLRLTQGVAGAEVQVWQPSRVQTMYSQADGTFACDLLQGELSVITVISGNRARSKRFSANSMGPYVVHLPPLGEREVSRIFVHDGVTGAPIASATVRINVDPGFRYLHLREQDDSIEPILELVTDESGIAAFSGFMQDLARGIYVEADGYLPKWVYAGGFESWDDSNNIHFNLEPQPLLPVYLVDEEGSPMAGIQVRTGFPASAWGHTDRNGLIPMSGTWVLAGNLKVEGRSPFLPQVIAATLPDGRAWNSRGYDYRISDVIILKDRIQIIMDLRSVSATLESSTLAEGEWIEAMVNTGVGEVGGGASWTRLVPGEETPIIVDRLGTIYGISLRLMPLGIRLPEFDVDGEKVHFTIPVEIERSTVVLEGPAVDARIPLTAEIKYGREPAWRAPLQEGRLIIPHSSEISWGSISVFREGGDSLLLSRDEYPAQVAAVVSLREPTGESHLREISSFTREVTITMNGYPVIGGLVDRQGIAPDGKVTMMFLENDDPVCDYADFFLPAILHAQSGGPILMQFYPSGHPRTIPGKLERDNNGKWFWKMELASVELLVPPNPERRLAGVKETRYGLSPNSRYPYHLSYDDWTTVGADATGGWLPFRVPAGRYRFRIDGVYFGDEDGVEILPSRINRLEPED